MAITFKSKKQINEDRPKLSLLVHDDYELIITEVLEKEQPKFNKPDEIEEVISVQLEIVAFKDGEKAQDVDGGDATGRRVFFTGRPSSMGFTQAGVASITRQLVAHATNQPIDEELYLDDWQDLVGKTIFAEIIQYDNSKGERRNKISRFLPSKRRTPRSQVDTETLLPEEAEDLNVDF